MKKYEIVETLCYPCKYKIEIIGSTNNNATYNYFKTTEEAEKEIKKRNGVIVRIRNIH